MTDDRDRDRGHFSTSDPVSEISVVDEKYYAAIGATLLQLFSGFCFSSEKAKNFMVFVKLFLILYFRSDPTPKYKLERLLPR